MASPTFNGNPIFDSLDSSGNNFSEGCLCVPAYMQIVQKIHFEGEDGDHTLFHGYPDMDWEFNGLISATIEADFKTILTGIQSAIDAANSTSSTYKTLVDSFDYTYHNAQVRTLVFTMLPHISTKFNCWVAGIKVTGVIQGHTQWGATS